MHIEPFGSIPTSNPTRCHRLRAAGRVRFGKGWASKMVARRKSAGRGFVGVFAAVACASLVAAGCFGFGIASAGSAGADSTTFGLGGTSDAVVLPASDVPSEVASSSVREGLPIASAAQRDVSQGYQEIEAEEEAARIAAEQERIAKERACIQQASAAKSAYLATYGSLPVADVDFSIGREAFIAEWTERINEYLRGFPLAGHGETFATAAWEYGVDPRWSPAISNTESTRGSVCFSPHNAWGWGQSAWSDWDSAIRAHVRGLSEVYGYTISYANAKKYCPPNYDNWYRDTRNEMAKI